MHFSFLYGGKKYGSKNLLPEKTATEAQGEAEKTVQTYRLGPLKIERTLIRYTPQAEYSLLTFTNEGSEDSGIISDVWDIDDAADVPSYDADLPIGRCGSEKNITKIYRVMGSDCGYDEYKTCEERTWPWGNRYSNAGGRSSQKLAPFFEVNNGHGEGFLLGIGWTGQWEVSFLRKPDSAEVRAGIPNLHFRLHPAESVRTASVLYVRYSGGRDEAHNEWRRLVREHFSYRRGGEQAPLSFQTWGGSTSAFLNDRICLIDREKLGFEYFWIDAGWYGDYKGYCKNEHTGEWGQYTGDWQPNRRAHPQQMRDVMQNIARAGMRPLLWFEPERVIDTTDFAKEHGDWLLKKTTAQPEEQTHEYLLNLGLPEAQEWMISLISDWVENCGLKCYRQDFNMDPLGYWDANDTEDRRGITQLKHIQGLYRVWDTLLEKYPDLIIDNCSSGGRRIDLETCRRAIPLWRSDAQCTFDYDPCLAQNQNTGLSWWICESGCGVGLDIMDKYRFRSCYATAMCSGFAGYEEFDISALDYQTIREYIAEYKSVRDYFRYNYYPIFGQPTDNYSWAGWQYHKADTSEGIIMAFRRPQSRSDTALVFPKGFNEAEIYVFEDADTHETRVCGGSELLEEGFRISLPSPRSSKLIRYRPLRQPHAGM